MTENDTIRTLTGHVSVRSFTEEPVSQADRDAVMEAARAASSTTFLQAVSVIRITDPAEKALLADLAGNQKHIAAAPEFWVFCADFSRCRKAAPEADLSWTEQFLVGCLDTGIMAQNAFAALESLGLGGVYAGGLRNHISEVDRLLALPQHVIPVVGLAFGHPASRNALKPRLPASVLMSENRYRPVSDAELASYDRQMAAYYQSRSSTPVDTDWSRHTAKVLSRERRPFVLDYVRSKGFALK